MRSFHAITVAALFVAILILPAMVRAQAGAPSDTLSEITQDSSGATVPLNGPPPVAFVLPEASEGTVVNVPIPSRNIDFHEASTTSLIISDRLHVDPYEVTILSDLETGLARRPTATLIPASAAEAFLPISFQAHSDGDQAGTTQESDTLRIIHGFYSGGPVNTVFSQTLVETAEGPAEVVNFTVPAVQFDIEESLAESGGVAGVISDYVDLPQISGFFLSSDNPQDYESLSPANGFVVEDFINGGGVSYALGFTSDSVPEPGSALVGCLGAMGMSLLRRRAQ